LVPANGTAISPLMTAGGGMSLVQAGDVKIYRNQQALPNVFLVHQAKRAQNGEEALTAISDPSFDPASSAIVEASPEPARSTSLIGRILRRLALLQRRSEAAPLPESWFQTQPDSPGSPPDQVVIQERSPEKIVVATQSSRAGFLMVANSFFP